MYHRTLLNLSNGVGVSVTVIIEMIIISLGSCQKSIFSRSQSSVNRLYRQALPFPSIGKQSLLSSS